MVIKFKSETIEAVYNTLNLLNVQGIENSAHITKIAQLLKQFEVEKEGENG